MSKLYAIIKGWYYYLTASSKNKKLSSERTAICNNCQHRYKRLNLCNACGLRMQRHFGQVGVQFKGSGFYKTDNPK